MRLLVEDAPAARPARARWRRIGRTALGWVLLILAVPLGAVAALVVFFGGALGIASVPVLAASALAALLLVGGGLAWLGGGRLRVRRRGLLGGGVASAAALIVAGLAAVTVFSPGPVAATPQPPPGVRFWELPTGSRIAYSHVPAAGTRHPAPVVFLHGGPGTPGDHTRSREETVLSRAGFDVYAYDQVGGGWSNRLSDVRDYTVRRHVADLEAVRRRIGADRMILIGQSWGGTLAAAYLAAHPGRVERVVFSSPGALWAPAYEKTGEGELWDRLTPDQERRIDGLTTPRLLAWDLLSQINPRAAHGLMPDAELDTVFGRLLTIAAPAVLCDRSRTLTVPRSRPGFYVNQMTARDQLRTPDPRPALRRLDTPALVLKAECDYKSWDVTYDYKRTLPNSTLLYVRGAGHEISAERPELYADILRAFLTGGTLPIRPYAASGAPS